MVESEISKQKNSINKKFENEYEQCIICGKETSIKRNENIAFRKFYVEGAGQLCPECWKSTYK